MQSKNIKPILVIGLLIAFFLGAMIPMFMYWVDNAGHFMISRQGAGDYLLALTWAVAIAITIAFLPIDKVIKPALLWVWVARCLVTLFAMLYYENHYNLDAYLYHHDIVNHIFQNKFSFYNGTNFVVLIGNFVNSWLPTNDSYHAIKVVWSLFGLIGVYQFYRAYRIFHPEHNPQLLFALGLCPSILFWSSTLGKDPIATLGIGLTVYGIIALHKRILVSDILTLAAGLIIMTMTRYWLASIFTLPALVSFTLSRTRFSWSQTFGILVLIPTIYYFLSYTQIAVSLLGSSELFETMNKITSSWSHGGSALEAPSFNSAVDVIKFYPLGFLTAIFRPLPGDVWNLFGFLAGIESLAIIYMAYRILRSFRLKTIVSPAIYVATSIFFWGSFYAFISYQNLGTAARFRAQILPLIILLLFMTQDKTNTPHLHKKTKPQKPPADALPIEL